jgi:3-deoxy-D-manno-octulosonate 8-phosphate phosphatase (KDO 8-P phosphatase)
MKEVIDSNRTINFNSIKAVILDWDGVFHFGYKNSGGESQFSEADSMGLNMLRLGYYLKTNSIPYTAIVTGEQNPTGHYLAEREHFDHIFYKIKDKKIIADYLLQEKGIKAEEILFVFDDILDLSLAKIVGARFLVKRSASQLLQGYILDNQLCDFITEYDGGNHAVREICEFILNEMGILEKTFNTRIAFDEIYSEYLSKRQSVITSKLTIKEGKLIKG